MSRIRCRYIDCIFLEGGLCEADAVEIDPDEGCLTYTEIEDISLIEDEEWEEEDLEEDREEENDDI